MRQKFFALILLAMPVLAADPKTEIRQLSAAVQKARLARDSDSFIKYVSEDYHQLSRARGLLDRDAIIEQFKSSGNPPADLKAEEVSLSIHGDSAILIRKQFWTNSAGKAMKSYFTEVFAKEKGSWKLAAGFVTDIP